MILEMFCEGEGETLELSSLDKNYGLGENRTQANVQSIRYALS